MPDKIEEQEYLNIYPKDKVYPWLPSKEDLEELKKGIENTIQSIINLYNSKEMTISRENAEKLALWFLGYNTPALSDELINEFSNILKDDLNAKKR